MQKLVRIPCKTCGTEFMPKSQKNKFCSRKCFKKDFYHRKKAEELHSQKFPHFLCPLCKERIMLDFDPVKDEKKWLGYSCPKCSVLMINVSEDIIIQSVTNT